MERNFQLDWQLIVNTAVKRRKQAKLTQSQLAKLAGVSKPTVIRFEAGKSNITLTSVFAILKLLGLLV